MTEWRGWSLEDLVALWITWILLLNTLSDILLLIALFDAKCSHNGLQLGVKESIQFEQRKIDSMIRFGQRRTSIVSHLESCHKHAMIWYCSYWNLQISQFLTLAFWTRSWLLGDCRSYVDKPLVSQLPLWLLCEDWARLPGLCPEWHLPTRLEYLARVLAAQLGTLICLRFCTFWLFPESDIVDGEIAVQQYHQLHILRRLEQKLTRCASPIGTFSFSQKIREFPFRNLKWNVKRSHNLLVNCVRVIKNSGTDKYKRIPYRIGYLP